MKNNNNTRGSYEKLNYIQKVSRINRRLRQGDVVEVSWRTGFSAAHVSDVLSGKYTNERIVNKAYDMTRNRKENASYMA